MGGSSLPADLVNDILGTEVPLQIVRDYQLPSSISPKDLVICASFSGNTEETLEVLEEAMGIGCQTVIMTHGGNLKKIAEAKNLTFIPIPDCIQPRCATGYFFASTLCLLYCLGKLDSKKAELEELASYLKGRQDKYETKGKALAQQLKDRVPIIYGPPSLGGTCRIWKIKINENAKIQSFFNVFPELNHNEMVGYTKLIMKPALIYLKSHFMHPRIQKRMGVMKDLLEKQIPIHEIELSGKNLLQETFEALAMGDYTSYYLAQAYGVEPAPVEMVEDFKVKLQT